MRLAFAIVVIGCGRSTPEPPATPACEPTITGAVQRITSNDKLAAADRTKLTMIASCESEHWSAEALGCIASARVAVDLSTCTEKLTYEQHERLQHKLATLDVVDAGVRADATMVAVPTDAAVDAPPIDATVPVDAHAPSSDAARPAMRDGPPPDCRDAVVEVTKPCIRQFCAAHPTEVRCMAE